MGALVTVGELWHREMRQMYRRPLRIASFLIQPLLWLALFGLGLRSLGVRPQGYDYVLYILPGILVQRLLSSASRGGMSVLRDKQSGFLREVFVAPVPRGGILLGVTLGVVTRAVLEGLLLVAVGYFLGLRLGHDPWVFANKITALIVLMIAVGMALVMLGIALAWMSDDPMTFGVASNWAIFPLTLLSGALYPVSRLPAWLAAVSKANPLTYGVDALRQVCLGSRAGNFPFWVDVTVIVAFVILGLLLGSYYLSKASTKA